MTITRLGNRLSELEEAADHPDTADHARQQIAKLENLTSELKSIHFQVIDLIDAEDERSLEREQEYLDKLDDDVMSFVFRLQRLSQAKPNPHTPAVSHRTMLSRKLLRLERSISSTRDELNSMHEDVDVSLIEAHRERLSDNKKELAVIFEELLALGLDDADELFVQHGNLEKLLFGCSHKARQLLVSPSGSNATSAVEGNGVKLPKLDVPTFDGDILNWRQFWEQFSVSVHSRARICLMLRS